MLAPARWHRRRSAFTLIELIVVVIIIAVLAAIGVVAYNQYAAHARDAELLASATNISHAITAKAAQDDLSTDAEVAAAWPSGGTSGDAALKTAFATSYSGTLTYTAGQGTGAAGTVDVAAASSGRHACIQLTAVTSLPASVHLGGCGGGSDPGGVSLPAECDTASNPTLLDLCQAVRTTYAYVADNPQYVGAYDASSVPTDPAHAPAGMAVQAMPTLPATLTDAKTIAPKAAYAVEEFVAPAPADPTGFCWLAATPDYPSSPSPAEVYWYDSALNTVTNGADNPPDTFSGLNAPPGGACYAAFSSPPADPTAPDTSQIVLTSATGGNAQIALTWDENDTAVGGYTATCTAAADGDTGSMYVANPGVTTTTVAGLENFVTYSCQVTGVDSAGATIPVQAPMDATPSVNLSAPTDPCSNLEAVAAGTPDGTCQTIEEDPSAPPVPTQGYGSPPPDTSGSGLWGVTSFPSDDPAPPHVFYVTNHSNGALYQVYQSANPASSSPTVAPATVGYLFAPGAFTAPAGEATGPSPLTGGGAGGITTLYVADSGTGVLWRVDPFARTRHKVATGLANPTEVTGFACYDSSGAKTSGVCVYVATDAGVIALKLGADGSAASQRTVTGTVATGLWLTSGGTLRVSDGTAVQNVDPGTGAVTGTAAASGTHLAGVASSPATGMDVPVGDVVVDTGSSAYSGRLLSTAGTVLASGLNFPRDVHNHGNAPWEYVSTPTRLMAVNLTTGQVVTVWTWGTSGWTVQAAGSYTLPAPVMAPAGTCSGCGFTPGPGNVVYYGHQVANSSWYSIRAYDTVSGTSVLVAGQETTAPASGTTSWPADGPATQTLTMAPGRMQVGPDGALYFLVTGAQTRLYRLDMVAGTLSLYAGDGTAPSAGDNGTLARNAGLNGGATDFRFSSGTMYFTVSTAVESITADGVLHVLAGIPGTSSPAWAGQSTGATSVALVGPSLVPLVTLSGGDCTNVPTCSLHDAAGNMYVFASGRLAKITPGGQLVAVAGDGTSWGSTYATLTAPDSNVPATSTALDQANGLSVDPYGNVYLLDEYDPNGATYLRRVDAVSGVVTTIGQGVNSWTGYDGSLQPAMSVLPFYGQPLGWDAAAGGLRLWGVLGYPDADNNVDRVTFLLTP